MLSDLAIQTSYRTGASDPVNDLFVPCLERSTLYLRAAGYFRSSILKLVGPAYEKFAAHGGTATVVCSVELEQEDVAAIQAGELVRDAAIERILLKDLDDMFGSEEFSHSARSLAALVASGALRVKIAYMPDAYGIYHEKIGCFQDLEGAVVSFIGSSNETFPAWSQKGNFESVEVFCSWHSERDKQRTDGHLRYLQDLLNNRVVGLEVIELPDAVRRHLLNRASQAKLEDDLTEGGHALARRPLPHQIATLKNWQLAGYRGVAKHATGSGKTFTALLAIKEHVRAGNPAIILVPSELLLQQWAREVNEEIPSAIVLLAGGGHTSWKDRLTLAAQTTKMDGSEPRVTIAVMATASSPEFVAKSRGGDHLLVIADEVHQVGSLQYSQALQIQAGKRLGLSATPERHGDPEGTERIFEYFGQVLEPVVTLRDAIHAGRLVPYSYYPHAVSLDEDEVATWVSLTLRIIRLLPPVGQALSSSAAEEIKKILIRRSRVAKRAAAKAPLAAKVLRENFANGDRWLVYCEDLSHVNEVAMHLEAQKIDCMRYFSSMESDKIATIKWFESQGGVLLSVRCLDEGVDIPSVTHALILASSQNPRQFIQRRGRVLRKTASKSMAVIHDALVLPVASESDDPMGSLESEFVRALEFAKDAANASCHADLLRIALASGIDIRKHYAATEDDHES